MKKIFLPVIAISLSIIAFCQLENTFRLVQEDAWEKYVGKEVGIAIRGAERGANATLVDLDKHHLILRLKNGRESTYNRQEIVVISEPFDL